MLDTTLIIFLFAIAVGAYVQTVTGFAMGLIIMGVTASLQLMPISFIAAVISLTALINIMLAIYKNHAYINWDIIKILIIGFVPAVFVGIYLLYYLDKTSTQILQQMLGIVIIVGGILLALKPHPSKKPPSHFVSIIVGILAGMMGGLYSTSAPPLIFYLYKQKLAIKIIRNTLLTIFLIGSIIRISTITIQGHITHDILLFALYSLPVVFASTWLGKKYPPPLSDINMRRAAFILLIILGISTSLTA